MIVLSTDFEGTVKAAAAKPSRHSVTEGQVREFLALAEAIGLVAFTEPAQAEVAPAPAA
jgi:hypothetical protein